MTQRRQAEGEGFGSDSFLDIVANIVGILIILVMVVGVRVKLSPETEPAPVEPPPPIDLSSGRALIGRLQDEGLALGSKLAATDAALAERRQRLSRGQHELEQRQMQRSQLQQQAEGQRQELANLQQEVLASQNYLGGLLRDLDQAKGARQKETVQIDSYPTPLSKTVAGPEAHFQVLGGRVAFVPLEELASRVRDHARSKLSLLRSAREVEAVVGPISGFGLRYTLRNVAGQPQIVKVTFIPENNQLGEQIEQALSPQLRMRSVLSKYDPATTTVTLWAYPDSFADYRRLKKELYLLGYSVAGRPREMGELITGSPYGSRSAAQ